MLDSATHRQRTSARSGSFVDGSHRRKYFAIMIGLLVIALGAAFGILAYGNPMDFGTTGFWRIAQMRASSIVVIIVVAFCHALATVSFQTATSNRIITPSIMGFESLYVTIQTAAVFVFGAAGVTLVSGLWQFAAQALLMIALSCALFGWLLSGRFSNIHIMLLVGVILGGGLRSVSAFMQRLLTPSEFDILQYRLFGNLSNAETDYLVIAIPVCAVTGTLLWLQARRLNVMTLGRETTINLGLNHRREVMKVLLLVSILMAMTTALVGPMTFLGFLVATLAYQLADTYDHRWLFPMAFLIGFAVLALAYFVLRHVFYAEGAVTIIIESVGGLTFLIYILRKGRL